MLRGSHVKFLNDLGHCWHKRRDETQIIVTEHSFWTTAYSFDEMKRIAPDLHADLEKSNLIVFKVKLFYIFWFHVNYTHQLLTLLET